MRWIGGVPAASSPHPDPPHQGEGTPASSIKLPFINGKVLGRSVKLPPSGQGLAAGWSKLQPPRGESRVGAVSQAPALRGEVSRRAGPNSLPLVGRVGVGAVSQAPALRGKVSRRAGPKLPPPPWGGLGWGAVKYPALPVLNPFLGPIHQPFPTSQDRSRTRRLRFRNGR